MRAVGTERYVSVMHTDTRFPAIVAHLDGWVCPAFRPKIAEAVVDWINQSGSVVNGVQLRATWVDSTIELVDVEMLGTPGCEPEVVRPEPDGRYSIGARGWPWQVGADRAPVGRHLHCEVRVPGDAGG